MNGTKDLAQTVLDRLQERGWMLATAESCTGGLIAAAITDIAGSSTVLDCGFVTYSNEAKQAMISVSPETLGRFGAVSAEAAVEMAQGAINASRADVAVSVTGIAGPGGGSADKPVGLVHMAVAMRGGTVHHHEFRFGDIGRRQVREATVRAALSILASFVQAGGVRE
jgi:nicotinamide-nucleotide amidase